MNVFRTPLRGESETHLPTATAIDRSSFPLVATVTAVTYESGRDVSTVNRGRCACLLLVNAKRTSARRMDSEGGADEEAVTYVFCCVTNERE